MAAAHPDLVADPKSLPAEDALIAAARALTAQLDVDGVCLAILDAVAQVFSATSSWILLHDPQTDTLRTRLFHGAGADVYADASIPADRGILGLAFRSREVVFVPDAKEDDRWFDSARVHASPLRSVFTVPLLHKGKPIGVLGLDAPCFNRDRAPGPVDIARLQALAAQAAIAITNARLFEASEQDRRHLRALLPERRRLRGHVSHLQQEIRAAYSLGEIVGESRALGDALQQTDLVAPADTTVLLVGETGTGKEVLARLIHERSQRARQAFVPVNCAALPEALVESELFGHEKGAFTGAVARKPGKFEVAHRGTLFLDEIGDLSLDAQAKLLRVLQDGQVQRVGSTQAMPVDVRLIAATNRDLDVAVANQRFRPDLFYRVSVFPIRVPPLRERREDIPLLARHFIRVFAERLRKPVEDLDPAARVALERYDWPGNVRELQNVIERAVILASAGTVTLACLALPAPVVPGTQTFPHRDVTTLADAERHVILAALAATDWRISGPRGAAERLGLKPTTLHAKLKKLAIRRPPREPGAAD